MSVPICRASAQQDWHLPHPASARLSTDELVRVYLRAKRLVVDCGYAHEVAWQSAAAEPLTPRRFVSEAAWVVLSTGMSESVVSRIFPRLASAFGDFDPDWLAVNGPAARDRTLCVFGHERKIDSILRIADTARRLGADGLRHRMLDPEPFLLQLPYIGPVTWRHLAKNLGSPLAKADRHLVRFATATRRQSVDELCMEISSWLGDPIPVVDVVLWRWSVLHTRSCDHGCSGFRPLGDHLGGTASS